MSRLRERTDSIHMISLMRGGKPCRATLRNVSAIGASATAPFPPGPKEAVQLVYRGNAIDCEVAWARGRAFGLRFVRPIAPQLLAELIAAGVVSE